jgi:hypothetical protein
MIQRWYADKLAHPVTVVKGSTIVRPEIIDVSTPPSQVTVHRTYEAFIKRLLKRGPVRRRTIDLRAEVEDGPVVRYEGWPAERRAPFKTATVYVFEGGLGDSTPLRVSEGGTYVFKRPDIEVGVAEYGSLKVSPGDKAVVKVEAPRDPDIELMAVSPHQGPTDLLREYVEQYLDAIQTDLDEADSRDAATLRENFFSEYGRALEGAGMIYADIEPQVITATPDEPGEFQITFHVERPGPMLFAVVGRILGEDGDLSFSELLPLNAGQ